MIRPHSMISRALVDTARFVSGFSVLIINP